VLPRETSGACHRSRASARNGSATRCRSKSAPDELPRSARRAPGRFRAGLQAGPVHPRNRREAGIRSSASATFTSDSSARTVPSRDDARERKRLFVAGALQQDRIDLLPGGFPVAGAQLDRRAQLRFHPVAEPLWALTIFFQRVAGGPRATALRQQRSQRQQQCWISGRRPQCPRFAVSMPASAPCERAPLRTSSPHEEHPGRVCYRGLRIEVSAHGICPKRKRMSLRSK